jgi:hypothetical protein
MRIAALAGTSGYAALQRTHMGFSLCWTSAHIAYGCVVVKFAAAGCMLHLFI